MFKYFTVWRITTLLSLQSTLENRYATIFLLTAKFLRFGFFILFINTVSKSVTTIASYTHTDLILFFLIFNCFDIFGQTFFRGIYWFKNQVVNGEFDFKLIQPINPLFASLTHQTDFLDLPLLGLILIQICHQPFHFTLNTFTATLLIIVSSLFIITSIHIAVAAQGIMSSEVDHTIMIFRDLSAMARFPIDIYTPLIRSLLTFVIPIAIAYTLPTKAVLGMVNLKTACLTFTASLVFFKLCLNFWQYSLKQYSSASS